MKKLLTIFFSLALIASIPSCKSKAKDSDVKEAVEMALAANPDFTGLRADVKDGVATITGEVKDEATRTAVTPAVSGVKGVKSVQNNVTAAPPPPPAPPVIVSADDALSKGVMDALKDHPTVKATVSNGVISVNGEATSAEWKNIKMSLDALRPKKVDAKDLKIKK